MSVVDWTFSIVQTMLEKKQLAFGVSLSTWFICAVSLYALYSCSVVNCGFRVFHLQLTIKYLF